MPLLDASTTPARPGPGRLLPLASLIPSDPPARWCATCHCLALNPDDHTCRAITPDSST